MPSDSARVSPVFAYRLWHINQATGGVNTTISAVSATGSQTVTPGSMTGIAVGVILRIDSGGSQEDVVVTAAGGGTFTATFAHTHAASTACVAPPYMQYAPIGNGVNTSSATSIVAGNNVTVTPVSLQGFEVGMKLSISGGTGAAEQVKVLAIQWAAGTFTANFANNHSGPYIIASMRGTHIGKLVINTVGTGVVITLYNGNPNIQPAPTSSLFGKIAVIDETTTTDFFYDGCCDWGLFYTLTGTPGDYTLGYLDMALVG